MWQNFSTKPVDGKPWHGVTLPLWVFGGFVFAQVVAGLLLALLKLLGVTFKGVNNAVFETTVSAVIYIFTLLIVIGLPWWIKKYRTTKEEVGINKLPRWAHL